MTKAQLIEQLKNLPDDWEILVDYDEDLMSIDDVSLYEGCSDFPGFAVISFKTGHWENGTWHEDQ